MLNTSPLYHADPALELEFKQHIFPTELVVYRILVLFGALIYGGFFFVDDLLLLPHIGIHKFVRLILVFPTTMIFFALSYTKLFINNHMLRRIAVIGSISAGQALHLFISMHEGIPDFYYLLVTLILLTWASAFMTISFMAKLIFGLVNVIGLFYYLVFHQELTLPIVALQMSSFIIILMIMLYAAYKNEEGHRKDFVLSRKISENSSGFTKIEQMTAHELKTSMRIINGLSYIIFRDKDNHLSQKSKDSLHLIREHINQLNQNVDFIQKEASQAEETEDDESQDPSPFHFPIT